MTTHRPVPLARTLVRAAALGTFTTVLLGTGAAVADPPAAWENTPHVSGLHWVTIFFLIPFGLFLLIALLASLPSMIKGDSYHAGQPWLGEPEWFGGPSGGVEAADETDQRAIESAGGQGGTGATF